MTAPTGLRERQKRRRAERILDATRELIRDRPERVPAVDAIAERAEVSPATVFNLVGPRERIWAALVDEALHAARERIAAADEPDPYRRAQLVARTVLDELLGDAVVYRLVLSQWTQSGALLREDPTEDLRACLTAARDGGALAPGADVDRLADHIATACTGAMHQWAAGLIDDAKLAERCATAVEIAFAAAGHAAPAAN